jgi:L-lactate dehydrogenase
MQKRAIGGGWVTYKGKGCTEYGICSAAAYMVDAILHDSKKILPASVELTGEYGEKDIFAGCPAVIGANGAEQVMEYNLPENELKEFKAYCTTIRNNIAKADNLLHR